MTTTSLNLRRDQLALLADACRGARMARIALRQGQANSAFSATRLLDLEDDALIVSVPAGNAIREAPPGSQVEVRFTHAGTRYAFSAETREDLPRFEKNGRALGVLRLSLPLRLERCDRRRHMRISFEGLPETRVTLTSMFDQQQQFTMTLTDVSEAGLGGVTESEFQSTWVAQNVFWAEFELSEEKKSFEFPVRLAHFRKLRESRQVALGWSFCPGEDPTRNLDNLERLHTYVRRQNAHECKRSQKRGEERR